MRIVQIFMGDEFYPEGGIEDLVQVLVGQPLPSDTEIAELFRAVADRKEWPYSSNWYWANACVVDETGVSEKYWWFIYFTARSGDPVPSKRLPYVTAVVEQGKFRYSVIPIEWIDDIPVPKGHPEIRSF